MIRLSTKLRAVILITVSVAALTGCRLDGGSTRGDTLDGTRWRLTEWTVSSLDPADLTITVGFAAGLVSGESGVNTYSGVYSTGPSDSFSVGQIVATKIGGPEPAMRAESAYLTLLGQAGSFTLADGRLTLSDDRGNESLLFDATSK